MRIAKLMKTEVHSAKPQDSVAPARAMLEEHRINQLLPVVVNRKLVGIVTDRDLRDARNAVEAATSDATHHSARAPQPDRIPVEAIMTTNVLTLGPTASIVDAAAMMRRERIGGVPIVDNGALIGIITRSDILNEFIALKEPGSAQ
jgi:acetoin utilization protein AcuB